MGKVWCGMLRPEYSYTLSAVKCYEQKLKRSMTLDYQDFLLLVSGMNHIHTAKQINPCQQFHFKSNTAISSTSRAWIAAASIGAVEALTIEASAGGTRRCGHNPRSCSRANKKEADPWRCRIYLFEQDRSGEDEEAGGVNQGSHVLELLRGLAELAAAP